MKRLSDVLVGRVSRARYVTTVTKRRVSSLRAEIRQYYDKNSYLSWSESRHMYVILGSNEPKNGLVVCPICKVGKIIAIRSKKTRKRFMGCSNYYNGCKASTPLLQKAMLRATKMPCDLCGWPIVVFRYSRKQKWARQCANINCQSRKAKD